MGRIPYQGLVTFWRAAHTQDLKDVDLAVYRWISSMSSGKRPLEQDKI